VDASAADVRAAAPRGTAGPDGEWLLGEPAASWRLPATKAAPFGVVVWLQGDAATLVEVRDPVLSADPETVLGPAEARLPSGLGPAQDQLLWPTRGLLLHVDRVTGTVTRLFGHEASSVAAMTDSPLAQIRLERRRARE
jgi:hypothetical protein